MAAGMTQAQARQAAIAAGAKPEEVDAFIQKEGGARTSAQRITSAFGVAGSVGTNDLSAYHAQKATPGGADASAKGTYLSGAMPGSGGGTPAPVPPPGGDGGGVQPPAPGGPSAPLAGLQAAAPPTSLGGGGADVAMGLEGGIMRQNLGRRILPMESAALTGLQKVY